MVKIDMEPLITLSNLSRMFLADKSSEAVSCNLSTGEHEAHLSI